MSSNILAIISLIVSAISAFASVFGILSFIANRREIISFAPTSPKSWDPIAKGEIIAKIKDGKKDKFEYFDNGFLIHLQFLNPSPHNIAYFDMHFEWEDKVSAPWNLKTFGYYDGPVKAILHDPKITTELFIPEAPQGVFNANSFTPLYLFASTDNGPIPKEATFSFKYAVRKFPYIGKKNHFSTFTMDLDLTELPKQLKLQQESMKQLMHQEQSKTKSKQTPPYSSKKRNHHK